ncbi:hypothetical protein BU26DRAFT_506746 [Trematosphaeria pertusa]|uniref:Uncharacterized protein n=1 Tax=Trematosphaeria pertusa TaxID=390896 RepID=A0A6A6IBA3_9PLEO|nr:uncharacterized protein BU26DRAFT_506746 [Trematosphaeria pertusa]KAF2247519.1 hypothetical protein BU26DRAFT_506746 [Trematosphaeria pertusa]
MRGSPISASSTPDGIREGSERLLARFDAVRVSSRAHFLFLTGDVAIALPLWASWALKMRCIRADRTARLYLLSRPRSWPGLVRWTRVVEQSIAGRELTPHDAALRRLHPVHHCDRCHHRDDKPPQTALTTAHTATTTSPQLCSPPPAAFCRRSLPAGLRPALTTARACSNPLAVHWVSLSARPAPHAPPAALPPAAALQISSVVASQLPIAGFVTHADAASRSLQALPADPLAAGFLETPTKTSHRGGTSQISLPEPPSGTSPLPFDRGIRGLCAGPRRPVTGGAVIRPAHWIRTSHLHCAAPGRRALFTTTSQRPWAPR